MAFRVNKDRQVYWPVSVQVPQDGGSTEESTVQLRFRLVKRTEMGHLASLQSGGVSEAEAVRFLADHVTGWADGAIVDDESGEPIAFSREALMALMEDVPFAKAVALALFEASLGAPRKNS